MSDSSFNDVARKLAGREPINFDGDTPDDNSFLQVLALDSNGKNAEIQNIYLSAIDTGDLTVNLYLMFPDGESALLEEYTKTITAGQISDVLDGANLVIKNEKLFLEISNANAAAEPYRGICHWKEMEDLTPDDQIDSEEERP